MLGCTFFVFNYKIFLINFRLLKKIINLIKYIKYVNYLYYHFKIIIFLYLYPLNYFLLIFGEKINKDTKKKINIFKN